MKRFGLLGSSALRSVVFAGLAMTAASPVMAQTTPEDDETTSSSDMEIAEGIPTADTNDAASNETITVTGSRIRRPNLESSVPVTSVAGEEFVEQSDVSVGDTLNELPQLASTFAQQNPGAGVGVAGLNLLDLRGLGTARTLTLVNGRRHVAGDIQNNAVSVDINTIPTDLIERVDIVTGAQSSIYGSDAIAGVVNFVLRRDFNGLQLRGNASVAAEGYGPKQLVSAMYGKNFGGGRGNVTVQAEYSRTDRIFGADIGRYRTSDGFFVVDVDPSGSDGIPDRIILNDVRSGTINRFGLVPVTQQIGGPAPCGTSGAANAAPFNCTFVFSPEGRLVAQTGTRFGTTLNPGFVGGNGQTGREGTLLSILPELDRYNANLLAHYEFSDAVELFVEAKYARVEGAGNNSGATFTQGGTFNDPLSRELIRLDNPFLNPEDRTTLANAFLASGCVPTIIGAACSATATSATRLTAAQRAQITAGTFRFPIGKQFLDLGIRDETFLRETYRGVIGLRGTFNQDWNYEVSANYGKFETEIDKSGYVDRQRFLLSLDSGRNPATGQIQCRAQFDPAAAVAYQNGGLQPAQNAFIASRLQADIAACVPYNPFGAGGANNQAAAAYFSGASHDTAFISQLDFSGFVSGDLSQLFELPGGPVGFAIGAEYRREDAGYTQLPLVLNGVTNALVLGNADPDEPTEVKEAFAEIRLPLLKDVPFFEELTLTAAGRVSHYNSIGTVYAYNAGAEWSPMAGVRFRGNYGRSVRAPNVAETAFPIVPNFAPGFSDPCRGDAIGAGSGTRQANCQADLGALLPNLASLGTPSLAVLSGSNPNLEEETSDSYTLGAVFQPDFIPGFSVSADYYDITVNNVIVALAAQTIANNCYDAPTLDNPFCPLFQRYRGPAGGGAFSEIPGQIQGNTLLQSGLNFAKRTRRGIDFDIAYRAALGPIRLDTNMIYVHTLESSNFQDPARPDFENVLLEELGTPADEFRWDTDLKYGDFTFGYQLRYIGKQYLLNSVAENFTTVNGEPPSNLDFATVSKYPRVFYHNIRFQWDITNPVSGKGGLRFYAGVDNLLNRFPPFGLTGTVGTDAIYETQGRTVYGGFRARF